MKITRGTIEHIKQLAILRQAGSLSQTGNVELFDSIDCLDLDELTELYAIVRVGERQSTEKYDAAVVEATGLGTGAAEQLFGLHELGTYLVAGMSQMKLS